MKKIFKFLFVFIIMIGIIYKFSIDCIMTNAFEYIKDDNNVNRVLNILDTYELNEKLELERKVNIDNKEYEFSYYLINPSNETINDFSFILDQRGIYKLKAYGKNKDSSIEFIKEFEVMQTLCSVSGSESSFILDNNKIKVSLVDGDKYVINKIFNLNNYTEKDEIFNMSITPSIEGKAEFTILKIKLIDTEDINSYINFTIQSSPTNPYASYALSGATNQPQTGFEKELGRLHRNNQWGSYFPLSFYGISGADNKISIRFNSETLEVFSKENYRIIDLDDPDFFSNKWKGFTSGKVTIEISAEGYLSNSANFTITSLQGSKIDSLYIEDNIKPVINVDCDEYNLPTALVNKEFKLFDATSYDDLDGERKVYVHVYENYLKSNQYDVGINRDNNTFTPLKEGIYSIVYTSYDKSNNKQTKVYEIKALNKIDDLRIAIQKSSIIATGYLGKKVDLAEYQVIGGTGSKNVTIKVTNSNGIVSVVDNYFIPEYEGSYEIVYTVNDYVGNSAFAMYNFTAKKTTDLVVVDESFVPKYIINNKYYKFEPISAISYVNGYPEQLLSEVYIKKGETKVKHDEKCLISGEDYLIVIYDFGSQSIEKIIPIIDVGEQNQMDLSKYFVESNGVNKETRDNGIYFSSNFNYEIDFIRELISRDLSFKFEVLDGDNIDNISIELSDSINEEEKVILTFKKNLNESIFLINNKALYYISSNGFTKDSRSNEFYIDIENAYINPYENILIKINSFVNGKDFDGFSSGKVYIKVIVEGTGESAILFKNICGQPLSTTMKDRIKPYISLPSNYGGEVNLRSIVNLDEAYALDVLDPNIKFTLKVTDSLGNIVKDINGNLMNNLDPGLKSSFEVSQYGSYLVTYEATDTNNGLTQNITYTIICEDNEKPSVDFLLSGDYRVDSLISIKNIKMNDNVTKELDLIAYVILPNGEMIRLENNAYSFKPNKKGIYKVCLYCYDEAGNMGSKIISIEVN